jgi:pyrroline-5-carboxylate reductase
MDKTIPAPLALRRMILRTTGEVVELDQRVPIEQLAAIIGCECAHVVMLADRLHVMYVDDNGVDKGLSHNVAATALYWQKCGGPVDAAIYGDVVVVPDSDYAEC